MDGTSIDDDLVAAVRDAALGEAARLGASHAEVRVERIRSQMVALRDGRLETAADDTEVGVGLRVVRDGSVGFAATVAVDADTAAGLAAQAVDAARTTALAGGRP
ncbi:MAG TPA: DNA gyrase modulator, partial [Acidimicrobiales bacterium]